jgi:hypothetical protein
MYKIYASKLDGMKRADLETLVPYTVPDKDSAAKQCVELFHKGYTIHAVVSPDGAKVGHRQLEHALKIGVESTRFALG